MGNYQEKQKYLGLAKYIKKETGDDIKRAIKERIEWGNTGIRQEENKGKG